MRRTLMMGFLCSVILCSVSLAQAQQVCWRLHDGAPNGGNPLLDVVQMVATPLPSNPQTFALHGDVAALPLYQQGGSGSAKPNGFDGSQFRVSLTLTHDTSAFGGNRVCGLTLLLNANAHADNYLHGIWFEQCAGGPGTPTNVSGFVHPFNCPAFGVAFGQDPGDEGAQGPSVFGSTRALGPGMAQADVQAQQLHAFGEFRAAGCDSEQPCLPEP
jgi:hypothetical protein